MILSVSEAQKRAGEVFPIALEESLAPESYARGTIRFASPVRLNGTYTFDGKSFHVVATAEVAYDAVCARCNKPFVESLSFPIDEHFVRDIAWEADQDVYPYTHEQLDLGKAFWDNLHLHLPLVSLCKPDCKGLCPVCGADRNTEPCACQSEIGSGPFGALQQLLNENKEV